MSKDETNEALLEEARQRAAHLRARLPKKIEIAALTLKSKLPMKAVSLREYLFHRFCQVTDASVEQFEKQRAVPAILLTRAGMETLALSYGLHVQLTAFLAQPKVDKIDKFLMDSLFASRVDPEMPPAKSILHFVDLLDKALPKFRANYDALSEYAHPNWSGVMGSFAQIDKEKFEILLGARPGMPWVSSGLNALTANQLAMEHYYNEMTDQLYAFNDHFEKA